MQWVHWYSEQQEELRYQVTYHTYVASGGRLLNTPRVELEVDAKLSFLVLNFFAICRLRYAYVRKRYQALPAFPYCKQQKIGRGLGTRLDYSLVSKMISWGRQV